MIKNYLQKIYTWLKFKLYDEDFCLFAFFLLLLILLICCGCKSPKHMVDETIVHIKDSTIINYRDSLIKVEIPVEKIVNIVALPDTLEMETSVAQAKAWVDTTTNSLKGSIENKKNAVIEKTVYLPSKEKIVYRDSIRKEPYPVYIDKVKYKVPPITKWLIVTLFGLVVIAYRKYIAKLFKIIASLF